MATADASSPSPSSQPRTSSPGAKLCSRCGQDCSAKPRSKDAQGRYVCGDCTGKATAVKSAGVNPNAQTANRPSTQAGRPAAAAAPAGDDDVMSKLVNESLELGKHGCPNCHARMKQSQTICVNCGYNRESGKMLRTVEQKAVVLKDKKPKGSGNRYASFSPGTASFWSLFLISLVLQCGIAAIGFQGLTAWWASSAFLGLIGLACWIWAVIAAFIEGETMYGICGIVVIIPIIGIIPGFMFLFYIFFVNDNPVIKACWAGGFCAGIVSYFAAANAAAQFGA